MKYVVLQMIGLNLTFLVEWDLAAIAFVYPLLFNYDSVQSFILIKNHGKTWVSKSSETKLFTCKIL